ncbi:hypothetical protein CN112_32175 [Sinorhizobium meliloti]|nr:hypothetical protein CN112_32175 [Sinorhizobium meliloti]
MKGIDKSSKWPNANARLLGVGLGLPVDPIDRLGTFSSDEFERFVLEWADGYLAVASATRHASRDRRRRGSRNGRSSGYVVAPAEHRC